MSIRTLFVESVLLDVILLCGGVHCTYLSKVFFEKHPKGHFCGIFVWFLNKGHTDVMRLVPMQLLNLALPLPPLSCPICLAFQPPPFHLLKPLDRFLLSYVRNRKSLNTHPRKLFLRKRTWEITSRAWLRNISHWIWKSSGSLSLTYSFGPLRISLSVLFPEAQNRKGLKAV